MTPMALHLRQFRSFRSLDHAIELRPITLIYGRNNAGKSGLLRALPMIADSLGYDGLDALNLGGRIKVLQPTFESLMWKGRAPEDDPFFEVGLLWGGDRPLDVRWGIREERNADWERFLVTRWEVREGVGASAVTSEGEWRAVAGEERSQRLSYRVSDRSGESIESLRWQGLSFETLDPHRGLPPVLGERLRAFRESVLWLKSLRPSPERYTEFSGGLRWSLNPDGSDAPIVLLKEPEVQRFVSQWYRDHTQRALVVEEPLRNQVRVALRSTQKAAFDMDLIDVGEGLSQVLPVLTALGMAAQSAKRGGPSILAIEEPEAHLHPDLARAVAVAACEVAAKGEARILFETHSEELILAVRLQVARQELKAQDVRIYWVDQNEDGASQVRPIDLDDQGRMIGDWPPDAFQEDLDLAGELLDVQERLDVQELRESKGTRGRGE